MGKVCNGKAFNDLKGYQKTPLGRRQYKLWCSMLSRCYNEKALERRPTYKGCQVCVRWRKFSNFIKDLPSIPGYQNWLISRDYQLDKDILLKGNKLYHPKLVCFVHRDINSGEANIRVQGKKCLADINNITLEYESIGDMSRKLGIPRTTLRHWLKGQYPNQNKYNVRYKD